MKEFKCDTCDKTFKYLSLFERHQQAHTNLRAFKCQHCEKTFNRADTLKTHMNIHLGSGYNCCGRLYHSKAALNYHTRTVHTAKVVNCKECACAFKDQKELDAHLEAHRVVESPTIFDCITAEECSTPQANAEPEQGYQLNSFVFFEDLYIKRNSFSFKSDSGIPNIFFKAWSRHSLILFKFIFWNCFVSIVHFRLFS